MTIKKWKCTQQGKFQNNAWCIFMHMNCHKKYYGLSVCLANGPLTLEICGGL